MTLSAHFDHDCPRCVFIGRAPWPEEDDLRDRDCDVYVCPQGGWPTVVMRFSSDGADYLSGAHQVGRLPLEMAERAQQLIDGWRDDRRCDAS